MFAERSEANHDLNRLLDKPVDTVGRMENIFRKWTGDHGLTFGGSPLPEDYGLAVAARARDEEGGGPVFSCCRANGLLRSWALISGEADWWLGYAVAPQAVEVQLHRIPGAGVEQVGEVVDQLQLGEIIDPPVDMGTDALDDTGVGLDGLE